METASNSFRLKSTRQVQPSLRYGHGNDERPWQAGVENVESDNTLEGKHTTRRGHGRAKADGTWVGTKNPIEIYAYSAFFDDRTSLMSLPVVRVIVVTEVNDSSTLYCLLRYGNRKQGHIFTGQQLGM